MLRATNSSLSSRANGDIDRVSQRACPRLPPASCRTFCPGSRTLRGRPQDSLLTKTGASIARRHKQATWCGLVGPHSVAAPATLPPPRALVGLPAPYLGRRPIRPRGSAGAGPPHALSSELDGRPDIYPSEDADDASVIRDIASSSTGSTTASLESIFRFLWAFVKPDFFLLAACLASMLVTAGFMVAGPLALGSVLNAAASASSQTLPLVSATSAASVSASTASASVLAAASSAAPALAALPDPISSTLLPLPTSLADALVSLTLSLYRPISTTLVSVFPALSSAPWAPGPLATPLPPHLSRALALLTLIYLGSALGTAAQSALSGILSDRVGHRLRKRLFASVITEQDMGAFERSGATATVLASLGADIALIQRGIRVLLGETGLRAIFEAAGVLAFVTAISPRMGALMLLLLPCLLAGTGHFAGAAARISARTQHLGARQLALANELLANVRVVRAFGRSPYEERRFLRTSERIMILGGRAAVLQGLLEMVARALVCSFLLLSISLGGDAVLSGRMAIGTCYACFNGNFSYTYALASFMVGAPAMARGVAAIGHLMGHPGMASVVGLGQGGVKGRPRAHVGIGGPSLTSAATIGAAPKLKLPLDPPLPLPPRRRGLSPASSSSASSSSTSSSTSSSSTTTATTSSSSSSSQIALAEEEVKDRETASPVPAAVTTAATASSTASTSATTTTASSGALAAPATATARAAAPPPLIQFPDSVYFPQGLQGRVTFRDVYFRYPSRPSRWALAGASLDAAPGTTLALAGRSGAGKSTVASLLLRFYEPERGVILLDGTDIRLLDPQWLRQQIGLVSQEPVLFQGSIASNIAYGRPSASRGEIESAARTANAHGFIMDLPAGYDTLLGERGVGLSSGQLQRLAIARALIKQPKVLVLDEAGSRMDAQGRAEVADALERAAKGRTTLVIAHLESTLRRADRVVVLDHGHVREEGSHEELLAMEGGRGLYQTLLKNLGGNQEATSDSFSGNFWGPTN
eukprot:jgi/Mesvir1/237/Mv13580-RA.1